VVEPTLFEPLLENLVMNGFIWRIHCARHSYFSF